MTSITSALLPLLDLSGSSPALALSVSVKLGVFSCL
jgi:hypothetical protein